MHRFGEFDVDVAGRELRHQGQLVHLEPQAFDLLAYLLEHRDRVVSKTELLDEVWGHRFVSEASLTTRVKEVRRAIGDDGTRQHAVRNVRGKGYRFVAPVEVADPVPQKRASALASLVGRNAEAAALVDLLGRSPLVTLIGPGGVGKSTLARAIAADAGPRHFDGVHVIELAALDAAEPVLPALARALDIVVDSDRPDAAIQSIARLDALVVLDNCEHVVDDVTALVDRALSAVDCRVRIVATSQVRPGVSAEVVVPIGPLPCSDATELFTARARAVVPTWDPDIAGRHRVDDLVTALDRLPLTIEMAAARLASMSFDELEEAIGEKAPLLQITHRAPARRHRSLGSVVDWSTTLLEPHHHQLFCDFAVFAGRVTASDAAKVLRPADPASATFGLVSLAERSLLVTDVDDAETRYGMLTTVRAVAMAQMEASGRGEEMSRRHAEHVCDAVRDVDDRLRTPDEAAARRRLARLTDETRTAHRWAQHHDVSLASELSAALFHGAYSNLWNEPAEWSDALLRRNPGDTVELLAGAVLVSAGAAAHRGDLRHAREQAGSVAASAAGRLLAGAFEVLADVALYDGDLAAAARYAAELHRLGNDLGDPHMLAFAAVDAALARAYGGDPAGALDELESLDLGVLAPTDGAWLAYARGDAASMDGDPGAADAFQDAIDLGTLVGNRFVVSVARTSLAINIARAGEIEQAFAVYAQAFEDFRRHGNHTHAVTAIRNVIPLLEAVGDDRGAAVLAATVTDWGFRTSYGMEAAIAAVVDRIQDRAGSSRIDEWSAEGRALDVDGAVRLAAKVVDQHRA